MGSSSPDCRILVLALLYKDPCVCVGGRACLQPLLSPGCPAPCQCHPAEPEASGCEKEEG